MTTGLSGARWRTAANAGTPCGDSFIDPQKECRVGESAETPAQKEVRVKEWNDKHSEVVRRTGKDAWAVVEQVASGGTTHAEQMAAMDRMIAEHGDKPMEWEPDNLLPLDKFETGDWETREQEAVRRLKWVEFNKARTLFRDELAKSDIPNDQKREYLDSVQHVLTYMPKEAISALSANVEGVKWYPDTLSLTKEINRLDRKGKAGRMVGGAWQSSMYSAKGVLHLDGGLGGWQEMRGIHAHEMGHACDWVQVRDPNDEEDTGTGHRISWEWEWRKAYEDEIQSGHLSNYAKKNPTEGFAEFARLCWGSGQRPKSIAAEFPKCYAVFKKHKLA